MAAIGDTVLYRIGGAGDSDSTPVLRPATVVDVYEGGGLVLRVAINRYRDSIDAATHVCGVCDGQTLVVGGGPDDPAPTEEVEVTQEVAAPDGTVTTEVVTVVQQVAGWVPGAREGSAVGCWRVR